MIQLCHRYPKFCLEVFVSMFSIINDSIAGIKVASVTERSKVILLVPETYMGKKKKSNNHPLISEASKVDLGIIDRG